MQVPILTYHGNVVNGHTYQDNDHVALQQDLVLIAELGLRVISLDALMQWCFGQLPDAAVEAAVVLTCDDGTWFDYYDVEHPSWGVQRSFLNILKDHQEHSGHSVHMTNFVIVSPDARAALDSICMVNRGWWTDEWWLAAQKTGLMAIENHSWDHQHGIFDNPNVTDDSFVSVADLASCERQLRQSQAFLQTHFKGQHSPRYFAYPYGDFSDYLRFDYLPRHGAEIGLTAAFTTEPKHVTKTAKRWAMPRYVCHQDWNSGAELRELLLF